MKSKLDMSSDLVVAELLRLPAEGALHAEVHDTLMKMSAEVRDGRDLDLASLLQVPSRSSIWIRDANLRALIQSMKQPTRWERCGAAKALVDHFCDKHLDKWQSHISSHGRRPQPLRRPKWFYGAAIGLHKPKMLVTAIGSFEFPSDNPQKPEDHFLMYLLAASAQCQRIPRTQRALYNLANAPTNKLVERIEERTVREYLQPIAAGFRPSSVFP